MVVAFARAAGVKRVVMMRTKRRARAVVLFIVVFSYLILY
jgi:hypothetical protein